MTNTEKHRIKLDLYEALLGSLDVQRVFADAYPLLLKLTRADYGALGASANDATGSYDWTVAGLPPAFFANYEEEMAPHDFVRLAVVRRPNLVLRDADMIDRAALEANMMYQRARDVGVPLEHVIAVMLDVQPGLFSGVALYRSERRPFTVEDTRALQEVTAALRNTVRNCHLARGAAQKEQALETLLESKGIAALLVVPPSTEIARTSRASSIIDRWFAPGERRAGGIPDPIALILAAAANPGGPPTGAPGTWIRSADAQQLRVQLFEMPGGFGNRVWIVVLEEADDVGTVPKSWRGPLTPREAEVAACALRGWDNQLIANELCCRVTTVKKHLERIFDKLGVSSRAALVHLAATTRRGSRDESAM